MLVTLAGGNVNIKRYREWRAVLKLEGRRLEWGVVIPLLLKFWNWRSRGETITQLRLCWPCPVFNRRRHQCRPHPGSALGCGCHQPTKVFFGGGCWGDAHPELGVGWKVQVLANALNQQKTSKVF